MKTVSACFALTLPLLLGACGHYSDDLSSLDRSLGTTTTEYVAIAPQEIAPAAGGQTALPQSLAREYYTLARHENDKAYDYKAAKLYTQKAKIAAAGQVVSPSKIESYSLSPQYRDDLVQARADLVTAIKDKNVPGNEVSLAKAQTSFDCWLEQAEEARDDAHFAGCRDAYQAAMATLVTPAAGEAPELPGVDMGFSFNSTVIEPEVLPALDKMADFLLSQEGNKYTAVITGYAVGNPPSEASRQLATSRALVINHALRQRGVPAEALKPQLASASTYVTGSNMLQYGPQEQSSDFSAENSVQVHFEPIEKPVENKNP